MIRRTGTASFLCLVLTWIVSAVTAQVPSADLYVFQLTRDDTARWHIHSPQFLSRWNPGGYTNQPEWIDKDRLLVSGKKANADQNEIYLLNLDSRVLRRCTDTPESEFSPRLTPDGHSFSVVRQVHSDSMDQQIFAFPLDLSGPGHALFPNVLDVGYYCWLDHDAVALFLVDDPPKLAFLDKGDENPRIYSSLIGRCLARKSDGNLAYVHKYSDSFWYLKNFDVTTRRSEILVETPEGSEDFAISPSGVYFMGKGSQLLAYDPAKIPAKWVPVADLSLFGIKHITRLAISPDNRIAVVDQKD